MYQNYLSTNQTHLQTIDQYNMYNIQGYKLHTSQENNKFKFLYPKVNSFSVQRKLPKSNKIQLFQTFPTCIAIGKFLRNLPPNAKLSQIDLSDL